jgi:N-acetylglucosaminyldiphosphoundecaprenol N-acetyl-beta-D-mannosaminyltransferase
MARSISLPDGLPLNSRVRFLGFDFAPLGLAGALAHLSRTASAAKDFSFVVTPNVDHRVRLEGDPSLWPLYAQAGLVLNDSRIFERLAKFDGLDLPASPGADLVAGLFETVIARDEPVTVIGTRAEDIDAIRARFGLTHLVWHDAPQGLRKNPQAIAEAAAFLAAHPARFHFLCVGSPQQEMIAAEALARGDVKGIGLCCGASLDFLSGRTARAPAFLQRAGLEWLHRMLSEPGRLVRRYLVEGPAIFSIWWRQRKKNDGAPV